MFAMAHKEVVEIGFNSGFSALLMLTANPELKLTCVDICEHKYTEPCFQYLKTVFEDRITLVKGDSTVVLPEVLQSNKSLTGYIIDGGHGLDVAEQDLQNVIKYANDGAILCFDDSDFVELRMMLNMYMMSGHLINFMDEFGPTQNQTQMFFKIVATS
jgi:predicted O-methyltransferase YrrM